MSPPKIQRIMYLLSKLWDHNAFASVVFLSVQHTCSWYGQRAYNGYWSTITTMNQKLLSRDNNVQLQLSTCYTCHIIHDVTYKQARHSTTMRYDLERSFALISDETLQQTTSICMYNLACNVTTVTSAETLNSILLMHWLYIWRVITVLHHPSNPLFQQTITITSDETLSAPCCPHTYLEYKNIFSTHMVHFTIQMYKLRHL